MELQLSKNIEQWQNFIDAFVEMLGVSAGLIMKADEERIKVLVRSKNQDNPYKVGDNGCLIGFGHFYEHMMNSKKDGIISNASYETKWKINPGNKLDIKSFLGLPINLPDGKPFGLICVLDNKKTEFPLVAEKLLGQFRNLIESEIELLIRNEKLGAFFSTDTLTGMLNRIPFFGLVEREIDRANRYKRIFTLLILDIDDFKNLNARYDRYISDKVLLQVSEISQLNLRATDIIGRCDGGKFMLLMPETNLNGAKKAAERLREKFEHSGVYVFGEFIPITVSISIVEYTKGDTFPSIMEIAEKLLDQAQKTGGNCVCAAPHFRNHSRAVE